MKDATFTVDAHEIRVLAGPYLHDRKPTSEAYEFAATLIGLLNQMREFASQRYLGIYNETWREEEDPVIDKSEFCKRLTNPLITLYDEIGAATIYFDDSQMFAGHSMEVSVDNGRIVHASLIG